MDEEKKKKGDKITVKIIITGILEFIASAEGNMALKALVLIILVVGFVVALLKAPQDRNDILSYYCLVVALGFFYIPFLIHEQSISQQ